MGPGLKAGFIWKKCWRPFFTLMFPLVLSVIFLWKGKKLTPDMDQTEVGIKQLKKQARAAFVVILMACYWVSECLPLPATALCPVFLLPLMGIVDTDEVAGCYLNSSVMVLLAGCIIAQAFEYSNLHTRIALKVACLVGAKVPMLLAGVMFTAMFLSMWMNNTSTTSMMVPILSVIMGEFEAGAVEAAAAAADAESSTRPSTMSINALEIKAQMEEIKKKNLAKTRRIKIMFLLGAAWASNIGGTGIITGTATNIIAQGAVSKMVERVKASTGFKDAKKCEHVLQISFLGWLEFNIVPMLLATILTWIILLVWFTGIPRCFKFRALTPVEQVETKELQKVTRNVEKAILAKYNQLGQITLHEILVLVIFSILVILWITGEMGEEGWMKEFKEIDKAYAEASIPAVLMCLFLFVIPKDLKYYKNFLNGGLTHGLKDPVLPWREVERNLPWGPLILIGGGIAISVAIRKSTLGSAIGRYLQESEALSKLPKEAYLAIILITVAFLTTIASNTATASILTPVLLELSTKKAVHPLYLVISATVSASYAFILPISTPPNAIVFDKSDMKQGEMALPGIIVTIVTNLVLYASIHTYCELIFKFNDYDDSCGPQ